MDVSLMADIVGGPVKDTSTGAVISIQEGAIAAETREQLAAARSGRTAPVGAVAHVIQLLNSIHTLSQVQPTVSMPKRLEMSYQGTSVSDPDPEKGVLEVELS